MPPFTRVLGLVAIAAAACGDDAPTVAEPYEGGSITPPGCDYTVTTVRGAEPPVVAGPELGPDPTVRQVRLGLTGDPRTTMAVAWRTVDDLTAAGTVQFGAAGALDRTAPSLTFRYQTDFGAGPPARMHEAHLCGLTPDTEYQYQIVSDAGHTSPVYRFRTAPDLAASPDAEVVIGVVGDSRGGYDVWARMVAQLVQRTPDLLVFTGDAVTIGPQQAEWDQFFTVGEPLFSQVPVLAIMGNHELNSVPYYSQFVLPGDESSYSLDYGQAHLTILNDSPEQLGDLTGKVQDFLASDLAAHASARWKLVSHHRPMYSASNHGSDTTLRNAWGPLIDAAHVDLVLNGHEHEYERTRVMKAVTVQATPADGTIYVVAGGAGAELYGNGSDFWTQMSTSLHAAVTVRIRRTLLELVAFDDAGAPVDTFTIDKP